MKRLFRLLGSAVVSLVIVYTVTFVLLRLPAVNALDTRISISELDRDAAERLRASYGMDQPVMVQYVRGAVGLVTGDWGRSMVTQQPVSLVISHRIRNSASLGLLTTGMMAVATIVILAAARRCRRILYAVNAASVVALGLPAYWTGTLVLLAVATLVPLAQGGMVLAAGVLAFHVTLPFIRMAAYTLEETTKQPYVLYATSRGLTPRRVFIRHIVQPSASHLLPYLGTQVIFLISGTIAIEAVFSWPGMGSALANAVIARDYPVVQTLIMLLAGVSIVVRGAVDGLLALLDPRPESA